MKKIGLIFATALSILVFNACKQKANDSAGSADSANVSKTQDTTAQKQHITVNQNDTKFAVTASGDGMAEVNAGKLASVKATSTRLKSFAEMMVTDHSKAGNELSGIAEKEGIALPTGIDTNAKQKAAELSKKSGRDFDRAYVDAMVEGHKKAISLFEDASKTLKDSALKAFAINTLPTIKMHLDSIEAIKKSMK